VIGHPVISDPRFQALPRKMNFPQQTAAKHLFRLLGKRPDNKMLSKRIFLKNFKNGRVKLKSQNKRGVGTLRQ